MTMLKKYLHFLLSRLLWRSYYAAGNEQGDLVVLRAWFLQKILRVNASVPWPVHPTTRVMSPGNIRRGTRAPGLSAGCHIDGRNGIHFGRNVWIGPYVTIVSMNHDVNDYHRWIDADPVVIGDDCWLGAHSVILAGVALGPHTVVAAGAVVTKSFPQGNQLLAGNPARIVKLLGGYQGSRAPD